MTLVRAKKCKQNDSKSTTNRVTEILIYFRYPELTTLSVPALINVLGPVDDETNSFCNVTSIERIRAPLLLPNLLEKVGRFLINSCGEATMLLKNIELVDAVPVCKNLWINLMNRMVENKDPALTELIVQNLTILINAVSNKQFYIWHMKPIVEGHFDFRITARNGSYG